MLNIAYRSMNYLFSASLHVFYFLRSSLWTLQQLHASPVFYLHTLTCLLFYQLVWACSCPGFLDFVVLINAIIIHSSRCLVALLISPSSQEWQLTSIYLPTHKVNSFGVSQALLSSKI